jgi:hypothetical protein
MCFGFDQSDRTEKIDGATNEIDGSSTSSFPPPFLHQYVRRPLKSLTVNQNMISVSGKYTECKPLFIEEQNIAIVASGSVLQLLALNTGDLVGSLRGHSSNVSSLVRHHSFKNHVI